MLVLARRETEEIFVGDDIRIVVVEVRDGRVRLGIEAPRDVQIDRREIRERRNSRVENGRMGP